MYSQLLILIISEASLDNLVLIQVHHAPRKGAEGSSEGTSLAAHLRIGETNAKSHANLQSQAQWELEQHRLQYALSLPCDYWGRDRGNQRKIIQWYYSMYYVIQQCNWNVGSWIRKSRWKMCVVPRTWLLSTWHFRFWMNSKSKLFMKIVEIDGWHKNIFWLMWCHQSWLASR